MKVFLLAFTYDYLQARARAKEKQKNHLSSIDWVKCQDQLRFDFHWSNVFVNISRIILPFSDVFFPFSVFLMRIYLITIALLGFHEKKKYINAIPEASWLLLLLGRSRLAECMMMMKIWSNANRRWNVEPTRAKWWMPDHRKREKETCIKHNSRH